MDYQTLDDVIFAAAEATRAHTGDKSEAVTAIYMLPSGEYGFSAPVGQGKSSKVEAKLRYPKGSKLMALVHNHPNAETVSEGQDEFSQADIDMAQQLGIPSAITFGKDMDIRMFTPGIDKVLRHKRTDYSPPARYSQGSAFNHIPEVRVTAQKLGGASALARVLK